MATLFSIFFPVVFVGLVIVVWIGVHLMATRQLGERKQGCKGPVPGEDGELLCCKGDGRICEEMEEHDDPGDAHRIAEEE